MTVVEAALTPIRQSETERYNAVFHSDLQSLFDISGRQKAEQLSEEDKRALVEEYNRLCKTDWEDTEPVDSIREMESIDWDTWISLEVGDTEDLAFQALKHDSTPYLFDTIETERGNLCSDIYRVEGECQYRHLSASRNVTVDATDRLIDALDIQMEGLLQACSTKEKQRLIAVHNMVCGDYFDSGVVRSIEELASRTYVNDVDTWISDNLVVRTPLNDVIKQALDNRNGLYLNRTDVRTVQVFEIESALGSESR